MEVKEFFSEEAVLKISNFINWKGYGYIYDKGNVWEAVKILRKVFSERFTSLLKMVDRIASSFTLTFNTSGSSSKEVFNDAVWPSIERFLITQLKRRKIMGFYFERFGAAPIPFPHKKLLGVSVSNYALNNFINNELWNEFLLILLPEYLIKLEEKYLTKILHFVTKGASSTSRLWAKYITIRGAIERYTGIGFEDFMRILPFHSFDVDRQLFVVDEENSDNSKVRILNFNKTSFEGSLEKLDNNRYKFLFSQFSHSATYEIPGEQFIKWFAVGFSSITDILVLPFKNFSGPISTKVFSHSWLTQKQLKDLTTNDDNLPYYGQLVGWETQKSPNVINLGVLPRGRSFSFEVLKSANLKLAKELEQFLESLNLPWRAVVGGDIRAFVAIGGSGHIKKILPVAYFTLDISWNGLILQMVCVLLPGGKGFWLIPRVYDFFMGHFSLFDVAQRFILSEIYSPISVSRYLNLPLLIDLFGIEVDWSGYVVEEVPEVKEFYVQSVLDIPNTLQIDGDLSLFDTADYVSAFFFEKSGEESRLILTDTTNDVWFGKYRSPIHAVLAKTGNLSALISVVQDFTLWPKYLDFYAYFDKYWKQQTGGENG